MALFAKVDENTMLGVMDWKGDAQPYVFVLEKGSTKYRLKW